MTEYEESLHFLDYWRIIRSRQEIVIAVSLLIILTGILVTYSRPRVYKATTLIEVKEETPDIPILRDDTHKMIYDPLFLRTQYEIIQSRVIIEEAVRQLQLNEKLGKAYGYLDELGAASFDQTVKLVTKSIKVGQRRDTNLIAIETYLSEPKETAPQEAAALANKLAAIYRETTMQRSRDEMDAALKEMRKSLDEQERNVTEQQAKIEDIRKKYKITSVGQQYGSESMMLDKISLNKMDNERIKALGELEIKKARYEKIMSLSPSDLLDAASHLVNDPALAFLVGKKREAQVQLSSLLSNASEGPKHPDVIRTKATINELDIKISEALKGMKTGVQADYEAAKTQLDAIDKMMAEGKDKDIQSEASGYGEFDKAQEELVDMKKLRDALKLRYREEEISLRIPRTTVKVWEIAKPADKSNPASPNVMLNILLSIVVGLATSVTLAYFVEYLDTSVKTIEDIERYMHVPVLGVIPQKVKTFAEDSGKGPDVEAYRVLRTNIHFSKKDKAIKTLCVTSGSVGEGKSLTLFNLAYVCAQLGDKVLLVDSDLHRPSQHKFFGVSNAIGLANVLIGQAELEKAILTTKFGNLDFLPSGKLASGGVHGLLGTQRMADLIDILKENYDLILFDAPPIIGVSDASLLVGRMDGVLLVVQHRKYPRSVSNRAKDMVQNVGANLVGVVLNNINITRDYSYYYHYYSYSHQDTGTGTKSATASV